MVTTHNSKLSWQNMANMLPPIWRYIHSELLQDILLVIESTNSCRLSEWHCIKVALPNQTVQLPTLWGISIVWHVPLGTWRWYAFQRGKNCPGGKPQVNTAILLNVILKHGSWMRNTMQLLCRIGPIFTWPTVYSKQELWWVRPLHQRAVLGN